MFRRKNCSNYNFVHFVGKSNWPSSCITAEKSLIYSKNATLLLSHNTSLVLFFVKCGVLAEALERVLKLWIRLGRDAIFDTLKTLFESSLRPNADRNFPASHVPGFVGIRTTRAHNQCFQRFATQKNTRAECFAICFYPRMVRTSCAIFSWCHTPQSQRGSSSPGV